MLSTLEPIGLAEGADVLFIRKNIGIFCALCKGFGPYPSFCTAGTAISFVIPE
jgi:hypothetical protein